MSDCIIEDLRYLFESLKTTGLDRNTIDKFYTKQLIVNDCVNHIKKFIKIDNNDLIIEPSAGNGAFIECIKLLSNNFLFYDIEPEHNQIIKQDYLLFSIDNIKTKYNNIHIIGNPPFGRQSSLAQKFIKKSCEFSKTISFILPKSFKKDSLKKSFSLDFHLIFEIDLPEKSFINNNIEYDVPCVFQIWEKRNINRNIINKLEPKGYIFLTKENNPDISFRRVGGNAGQFYKEILTKSIQSHYFIKFTNEKSVDENMSKISNIKFDFNNTVGPKSISKQELIEKMNKLLI